MSSTTFDNAARIEVFIGFLHKWTSSYALLSKDRKRGFGLAE